MAMQGCQIKFHGYHTLLNACIHKRAFREGQRVHSHMIKTHYSPPEFLRNRLLVFYCKCGGSLGDARYVLDEMPERSVVSWTALLSAYSQRGFVSDALSLFMLMSRSDTRPNEYTFATVLTSCSGLVGLQLGKQIHCLIIKRNFEINIFVGSSLLDMYAKGGRIHEARQVFESLPERDVVSCTAIISGYAQLGLDEDALEQFRRLQTEGMTPNFVTYSSVLAALSGLSALDLGKQVHSHILRRQLPFHEVMHNALIDMYSKCGNLACARRIFDNMPQKTIVSWNAMIVGHSKHGMGRDAVELFQSMQKDNRVKPDSVTLLGVLLGCSHGGMGDLGLSIFDEMVKGEYQVEPEIEHYGCIVSMLGRAGRVEEAYEFIKKMPMEPNATTWGTLLGACRVHSNVDIGEIVGHRLIECEPGNSSNYVILSNLYASASRWEDVRRVRDLMNKKTVKKEPGKSWIELDHTLHTFRASERVHPRREEVFAKVKELSARFKEAGYIPDLSCVLQDVDEEQKENILLGHSEKLAMTFALVSTSDGVPVRVIKNLRICVDCHNFAKYVSKIYGRKVSVRDQSSRFHHIVDGVCSCGEYW